MNSTNPSSIISADKSMKKLLFPLIIVFFVPLLLYVQTLKFGLTFFDDNKIISKNISFLSDAGNIGKVFQTDAFIREGGHFYRPLQTLSYMADIQISGDNNTWMFHFSNILLLGLTACLLYLLLRRLLIPTGLALLSTLIYCAHPLFVSSVAWLPARGDLLLAFFCLLSFLLFIEYLQKKSWVYLFLHWIAFTIALFCKETAIMLPLLFIGYYFVFSPEKSFEKKYIINITLYAISAIFWLWLRFEALENSYARNDALNLLEQNGKFGLGAILLNLRVVPESLANFLIPFDISPIPGFSLIKAFIGLVIITTVVILVFKNKAKAAGEKLFYLSWFLLLLLPTMLFKHETIDYLHHRLFLPLIGILLFLLSLVPKNWYEKEDIKRPWILILVFLLLSYFTFTNSSSYSDPMTYYDTAISKNSKSAFLYNNRGALYHNQGFLDMAIKDYSNSLALKPDYAIAYIGRGNAYFTQKWFDKAIDDYTKVIELKVDDANIYNNRGAAYIHLGKYDKACPDFVKAQELGSRAAGANINRFCRKTQNP